VGVNEFGESTPPEIPGGTPGPDNRLTDLEAKLTEAFGETERLREEWLRAKAETENVRRRGAEDVSKAHKFGIESFAAALLGVRDSVDAALSVESTSVESFKEGVELTARQLDAVFEKYHLKAVAPAAGEKFDPHRHQAMQMVPSGQPANTVVDVFQKGYLVNDRVLRPALVTVSSGSPQQA
jgi:molecular chaperone GrpE